MAGMRKLYCPYCGKHIDEECECEQIAAEERERFLEEYENDPEVNYGWHQQDIIDMYRRERQKGKANFQVDKL